MSNLEFVAHCPREVACANERAALLESASGHYAPSDRPLFVSGYNALCAVDLKGRRALEVCCGRGELAVQFARAYPETEVIANDRYPEAGQVIREAQARGEVPNLKYECGDALALKPHPDASLDLVFGQAALHHLAHDIGSIRLEYSRVLKPGGRLVFIFEPLGHNPFFSMIRAWRVSRGQMGDESNVFFGQLEEIGRNFSRCEVHVFNILGYPLKGVHGTLGQRLARWSHAADAALIARNPDRAKLAANFNVIFTK
jgi:SAM-dependent methyltransferase